MHRLVDAGMTKIRLGVDSLRRERSRPSGGLFPIRNVIDVIDMCRSFNINVELNIVLTKYNLAEIIDLLNFCMVRKLSAKVFEHVEVEVFGSSGAQASIMSRPVVSFEQFSAVIDANKFNLEVLVCCI